MAYLKKLLFGADGPLRTQNFTSCLTALDLLYCFTILHNERGQERNGNIINGFSERNLIQSNLVILEQKWYGVLLTLNLLSGFLINFTQQKDQEVHENFICCFWKNLICSYLIFSGHFLTFDWVWSQLSQATATIEYLKSQDMIKILKQSGHDFPGKRLCGGYYT